MFDWLLDKLIAEGFGCGGEAGEALALEPGFVGALAYIDVALSVVQHTVDQGRQLRILMNSNADSYPFRTLIPIFLERRFRSFLNSSERSNGAWNHHA